MEPSNFKWFSMALLLSLLMVSTIVLGQNTAEADLVGVKMGDWVKYKVISIGAPTIWGDLYDRALWIKVEVQNASTTNVTVRETRHLQDGRDRVRIISWNLQGPDTAPTHFIPPIVISANLGPGDIVEQCDIWTTYGNWINVELTLNDTAFRSYGGVAREVNLLEFSQCQPYFEYTANLTHKCYWDKETGFLLERIEQMTFLGYEETSVSIVRLEITDTNMWEMEAQPFWSQSWSWAIVGLTVTTGVGAVITLKSLKNRENKTKVYEK